MSEKLTMENENTIIVYIVCLSLTLQLKLSMLVLILMELIQTKRLCINNQLIAGLSFSNALEEILELSDCITNMMSGTSVYEGKDSIVTNTYFLTTEMCFSWFCCWLCIYFCLKIVTIKQTMYIYLQRRFPMMFPWIFIPSILVFALLSVLVAFEITAESSNTTSGISDETAPWRLNESKTNPCFTLIYIILSSVSFLLSSSSAVTIILSLYRHMKHMQGSAGGSRSPNLEAHIQAVKLVTLILILIVLSFSTLILCVYRDDDICIYSLAIVASLFQSIIFLSLMKASNKLKTICDILSLCPFRRKRENNHTIS